MCQHKVTRPHCGYVSSSGQVTSYWRTSAREELGRHPLGRLDGEGAASSPVSAISDITNKSLNIRFSSVNRKQNRSILNVYNMHSFGLKPNQPVKWSYWDEQWGQIYGEPVVCMCRFRIWDWCIRLLSQRGKSAMPVRLMFGNCDSVISLAFMLGDNNSNRMQVILARLRFSWYQSLHFEDCNIGWTQICSVLCGERTLLAAFGWVTSRKSSALRRPSLACHPWSDPLTLYFIIVVVVVVRVSLCV